MIPQNKILSIIFSLQLLLFSASRAQSDSVTYQWRATYDLKYIIDSTSKKPQEEYLILLFDNTKSAFYAFNTFVYDSLLATKYKNYSQQDRIPILYRYRTNFPEDLYTDIAAQNVTVTSGMTLKEEINPEYTEHINHTWKIGTEQKLINGVKCTKAEEDLFGRHWIAWFSTEYPMQFGPYKFFGLPGLIFRLEDDKDNYVYELYSIVKYKTTIPVRRYNTNRLQVTKAKYLELNDQFRYTTVKYSSVTDMTSSTGETMEEYLANLSKSLKKKKERENNPIELKPLP